MPAPSASAREERADQTPRITESRLGALRSPRAGAPYPALQVSATTRFARPATRLTRGFLPPSGDRSTTSLPSDPPAATSTLPPRQAVDRVGLPPLCTLRADDCIATFAFCMGVMDRDDLRLRCPLHDTFWRHLGAYLPLRAPHRSRSSYTVDRSASETSWRRRSGGAPVDDPRGTMGEKGCMCLDLGEAYGKEPRESRVDFGDG